MPIHAIRQPKTFYTYLSKFVLITIVGCFLLGLYFYITALSALYDMQNDVLIGKIDIAVKDMNAQDAIMLRIATEISISELFNPSTWNGKENQQINCWRSLSTIRRVPF